MYKMYVYSNEKEKNINIEHISNVIKNIYTIRNDIKMK